ncbi:ABC transporter permease [Vallitalea okinawensis]|uniref:ABC transporter permease n=1 Tax=Vallitalea okinawensis TaxID=2078660 RepID=UPI00130032B0|nr:ABC transporter permease [Vallitalea okinawensis]
MNYKNILHITSLELLTSFRNPIALAINLIMPILMVFIMGNIMQPLFDVAENGIDQFSILYHNQDDGPFGAAFDSFIHDEGSGFLNVIEMPIKTIEESISAAEYPAAIIIPENFSSLILYGETTEIQLIGSGNHPIEESTLKAFVNNFSLWTNTPLLFNDVIQEQNSNKSQSDTTKAFNEVFDDFGNSFIKEEVSINSIQQPINSFQFFAASMLVFFLLTSSMGIGCSLVDDRKNKTYKRIFSFQVKKSEYLLGKIIGNSFIAILQAISIILVTYFVFDVAWGQQYFGITILVLLIIFIASAIGILFSNLVRSSGALTTVLIIIFWFMAFVSGGFTGSPILESASKFTINHWAFNAFTSLMIGGELKDITGSLMVLICLALVLWTLGLVSYNRRASYE